MTHSTIEFRELRQDDPAVISQAFANQGWNKGIIQYQRYLFEQQQGKRAIVLAESEGAFVGYLTIQWKSGYPPFLEKGIPEVVDFNVLVKFQRRGIGSLLMDEAEKKIKEKSAVSGIGVGMTPDYGPAQILYTKRGYVPDGRGLYANGKYLTYGDQLQMGDDVVLHLTKDLS